jgi:glucose/arabinose dehydrogenase
MRGLAVVAFVSCLAAACAQDAERALPAGPAIAYEDAFPAQAGFDRPLYAAFHASDPAHAYVVTQPGRVFAVPRDAAAKERRTFLDLSGKVFLDNWEEGLLGFAFDPGYADNGFVWACWSEKVPVRAEVMANGKRHRSNRQSVIARYATRAADGGAREADAASELRVLEVFQPYGNHNGGTIEFGPDGMLYVALGDGGAANDPFGAGQSKATLLGKVLRIDVRGASAEKPYAIPADNPFVGEDGARGEIWCWGLRNPWRITFDRANGELWCGDVGQNRIEEVDRLEKGGNYGWNALEGSEVFTLRQGREVPAGAVPPIAEYPRSEGQSITGGYVYRGQRIAGLAGKYVYGDFQSLRMWAVAADARGGGAAPVVALANAPLQPSSFAEEPDGELLLCGFDGRRGRVFRLVAAAK